MIDTKKFSLSSNALKVLAALFMLIDHMGVILFPKLRALRYIGRLAFPIFAFFIAEGCKYTKNKLKYFLSMFLFGSAIQLVYYIYSGDIYLNVLFTFSLSIAIICSIYGIKDAFGTNIKRKKIISVCTFLFCFAAAFALNVFFEIDYGFTGCMLPVFASIPYFAKGSADNESATNKYTSILCFAIGLVPMIITYGDIHLFSLFSLPLLLLYSGKRGRLKMKYFFYIFYPAHLGLLQLIAFIAKNA